MCGAAPEPQSRGMSIVEQTVEIAAPVEEVFAYVEAR